jgi:hypothetical protein
MVWRKEIAQACFLLIPQGNITLSMWSNDELRLTFISLVWLPFFMMSVLMLKVQEDMMRAAQVPVSWLVNVFVLGDSD